MRHRRSTSASASTSPSIDDQFGKKVKNCYSGIFCPLKYQFIFLGVWAGPNVDFFGVVVCVVVVVVVVSVVVVSVVVITIFVTGAVFQSHAVVIVAL